MTKCSHVLSLFAAGFLAACGDAGEEPDDLLDPPPTGEGMQFKMTTSLDPGVEAEHCLFVTGPDEETWVSRDEVRFDEGSHHVLLYETDYDVIPTEKETGEVVDTSGVFDCTGGATNGWRISRLIAGSQNANGDSSLSFPPRVAMPVRAGAVLLINVHYINASDEKIEPEARINLYTVPKAEVDTEGGILFLYNPIIRVPARGSSRARWRCPVHQDITIVNVQSHMHARGVGYAAMVAGQEPFYENDSWTNVKVKSFEPGLEVPAGAKLDYYCDYQNGEDRTVYQGLRSTDEMCMLAGSYYPADPRTANCQDENGEHNRLAGEWIGEGNATCAETMDCMLGIDFANVENPLHPVIDCMVAADPAVSRESSDLMRCFVSSDDPMTECAGPMAACAGT